MNKLFILLFITTLVSLAYFFRPTNLVFAEKINPQSSNYIMENFGFGGGGTASSSSTNYSVFGTVGESDAASPSSQNFRAGEGLLYTMIASVPATPTFTNPNSNYNKLLIKINPTLNPSDYTYLIAISSDNFASDTRYIGSDNTPRTGYSVLDFRSFSSWGGTSGVFITNLNPGTTYTVKVKSRQGFYTESPFGATAQATTSNPILSFSVSPNSVNMGQLTPGSVTTAGTTVTATVTTNGTGGAIIYAYDSNSGLTSSSVGDTINAVSSDLSVAAQGYGIRGNSVTQTSGGPMEILSPYNGSA